MVESVLEMERNLRTEKLTIPELKVWMELKDKGMRDFILAATGGAVVSWFAGQKLGIVNRLCITSGTSLLCGVWTIDRTVNSYLDRILSLHGTRMQKELAVSLVRKYHDNPKIMERFSKHFYSEKVYDDSSDIPRLRWRFRNFYTDSAADFEAVTDGHNSNSNKSSQKWTVKETSLGSKPAQMNTSMEVMENPFDCIFGTSLGVEEINNTGRSNILSAGRSNMTPKRHTHGSKRHHFRRQRKHHREASEA